VVPVLTGELGDAGPASAETGEADDVAAAAVTEGAAAIDIGAAVFGAVAVPGAIAGLFPEAASLTAALVTGDAADAAVAAGACGVIVISLLERVPPVEIPVPVIDMV
jgi:hypothetical protein